MTPIETLTMNLNKISFVDLLDYSIQYKDKYFVIDKYISFMFEITPLLSAGNDSSNIIHSMLNNLPTGTIVQTIVYSSKYINHKLETEYLSKINKTFLNFAQERIKFLLNGTETSILKDSDFKVRNFKYFICFKLLNNIPIDSIDKIESGIKSNLQSIGLYPYMVNTNYLINICSEILNQSQDYTEQKYRYNNLIDINEQILHKENTLNVEKDHLKLGDYYYKTMTVTNYPDNWHLNNMKNLLGDIFNDNRTLPFGFVLTHNIIILDDKSEKNAFQTKFQALNHQMVFAGIRPKIKLKKFNYDYVAEQIEKDDRIMSHNLNIITFNTDINELEFQINTIKSYYKVLGFEIEKNTYIHLLSLINNLPLLFNPECDRILKLSSKNLSSSISHFLPIVGEWSGSLNPRILLLSRLGQLISFDLWDSPGGYNGCIIAKTGSGKSFLTNELISQYLAINGRIFCIDIGYSYKKLNDAYNGQFIDIDDTCNFNFNPFKNITNFEEDIDMIVNIIATMCVINEDLTDLQLNFIIEAVRTIWNEKAQNGTIDDLYNYFINHEDNRYHDLSLLINSFTSKGEFGKYFSSGNSINFEKNFISLDLEKIKNKRKLLNVILLSIISGISKSVYLGDRKKKQLIIIDEAWDLFDHPIVGKFLEAAYRKFRKYQASCFIIIQGLNDLFQTKSGRILYENSDWIFMLKQNPEAINSISKDDKMLLSKRQIDEMSSLTMKKGQFSEIMISSSIGQMGPKVIGRLVVDRMTQLIYSTTPNEVGLLNQIKKQYNCDIIQAAKKYIELENNNTDINDINENTIEFFRR